MQRQGTRGKGRGRRGEGEEFPSSSGTHNSPAAGTEKLLLNWKNNRAFKRQREGDLGKE